MDPDEVFHAFNEIISPDFSLVTGRKLNQAHNNCNSGDDAGGDMSCGKEMPDGTSEFVPQSNARTFSNESENGVPRNEQPRSRGNGTQDVHWTLFRPMELVYVGRNAGSWTKVAEEACVRVTGVEERAPSDEDDEKDKHSYVLRCVRACYNGHYFSLTKHSIEIGSSPQEIGNLTSEDLRVIPMRLLPPAERQDIQARVIARGKTYRRICERHHVLMQYEGPVVPLVRRTGWTWTTNQRVVVDAMAGRKMRSGCVNDRFTTSHRQQSLEAFLNTEGHSLPHGDGSSSRQGRDLTRDDAMPDANGKQNSLEHEKTGDDHKWTDIDYLTCPPTLVAFLLDEKVWANVQVEHLTDIVWPESPFDSLGLEIGKKELIQNLTRRFKTKEVSEGSHQDTGGGQEGNLIIFLTGPPGVGKTLTAEVVAEETHRPLYRVSAGELTLDPSALEKQLDDIFILARRWGAIILIDEAGMFMTKRRASTPDQNAAVTAFLRLFHTYDGLLFLTSTTKDIDTAFHDRIHATIKYTELDETQRTNIWRCQLQRAVGSPEGHPPSSRWPEEAYRLLGKVETNGREIRNIVRTAEQLALGLSTELVMKHVAAAMRNFGGSDNYVESICEQLEVLEEKVGGDRGLPYDDDVELQHSIGGRSDEL
ncbi:AAA family ATPase [Colletotrichum asianum]